MALTDEQFARWLRSDQARRVTTVEIDTDTPRHLSIHPYATRTTDATPNVLHKSVIEGGVSFKESLALNDGLPSISNGDIELNNEDGRLDEWLNEIWRGRAARVYVGDEAWAREDFRLVMNGVCADISSRTPRRLNIAMREKLQRLNWPVTEAVIGGGGQNKDALRPICLGECFNIEPVLIDASNHVYRVHDGQIERLIEVRDDGVPAEHTEDLAAGTFTLTQSPKGRITASVQGAKVGGVYRNTVAGLIELLATEYGRVGDRFDAGDIDSVNFAAFDAAHQQPVGLYLRDRANVLQCCQQLAASLGAQVVVSRLGLMRILQINLPVTGSTRTITRGEYEAGSLAIARRSEVIAGVRLGYCRNWTVQEGLTTGLPTEHKLMHATQWITSAEADSAVADAYRIDTEPEQIDTLLLREIDARAEADRRLDLWSVQRTVYRVTGYAHLLTLSLGDAVTLHGDRFGLQDGRAGVVVGLDSDYVGGRVEIEVLV